MAAMRDLPFPLVIVCLVFIRGYCPLPTSHATAMDPMKTLTPSGFSTEDLEMPPPDYYDDTVTQEMPVGALPDGQTIQRCNYNPCFEGQAPCAVLAASTGCLCPGFTLRNVVPESPFMKSVSWNGSEVVLKWCAPYSHVTSYIVTVGGQERQRFTGRQRSGALGDIVHKAEVCVFAVNEAGDSDGSCMAYKPRDNTLPLTAGIIGGALGFLLLLLLAVLLWRHKRQRKQEASISMHNTVETR
ncbi:uncharacterized protein [Brachyistius frenatus]|uniref:uncharacterized protein n=1 Tax=Brachyistius frenatus TaxID=100188 RepID=UPI0037E7CB21